MDGLGHGPSTRKRTRYSFTQGETMPANELSFFQKHTEKIALALGVAVLAGAGATQFLLGEPNAVEIDGQQVAPGAIADQVRSQVDRLEGKLNSGKEQIKAFVAPAYNENFIKLYDRQIADGPLRGVITDGGLDARLAVVDSPDYPTKVLPSPPVATDMVIKIGHGVLAGPNDARERAQVDALRQIIGDHRPSDFPYVSVRGTFPIATYRERLENAGSNDAQRIDESLWSRRMTVTAVYLLREQWNPALGQWGNLKIIRPLPGQLGLLPEDRPQFSREEADGLERQITERQQEIRQISFPRLLNGPWTPPDSDNRVFTAAELKQKADLEKELVGLRKRLDRLQNPGAGGQTRRGATRTRTGRGGDDDDEDGGDDGGFGNTYGGAAPATTPRGGRAGRTGRSTLADREQEKKQRQIDGLLKRINEKQTLLNNLLGVDDEGLGEAALSGNDAYFGDEDEDAGFGAGAYGAYGAPGGQGRGVEQGPEELRVWAHDVTGVPGETYRYKLVVSMFNPLYRQTRLTRQQLKENYDRVAIGPDKAELDAAPWSPPVTVAPKYFYFATSGNKDEKRAEFEVWTIYNGVWESGSFPEVPGNEIGGLAATAAPGGVQMNVGKILLDIDAVSTSGAGGSVQIRTLLLDQATGEIESRLVSEDRRSETREKLALERAEQIRRRDGLDASTAQR